MLFIKQKSKKINVFFVWLVYKVCTCPITPRRPRFEPELAGPLQVQTKTTTHYSCSFPRTAGRFLSSHCHAVPPPPAPHSDTTPRASWLACSVPIATGLLMPCSACVLAYASGRAGEMHGTATAWVRKACARMVVENEDESERQLPVPSSGSRIHGQGG